MSVVATEDIVTGCVAYLQAQPEVLAAVDTFNIGGRVIDGVFGYRLWTRMEQSQKTSIVIAHDGGWAAPNMHNTLRFPRILLNVWADPLRDGTGNNIDPLVAGRANACFEIVDRFLHLTAGAERMFGSIRVISCVRLTEPVPIDVPDGDGLIRIQAYYAATQG